MKKFSLVPVFILAAFALALPIGSVFAATPGFGNLYYNGMIVGTVIPPAAFPNTGIDNFYKVTNDVTAQFRITSDGPAPDSTHRGAANRSRTNYRPYHSSIQHIKPCTKSASC